MKEKLMRGYHHPVDEFITSEENGNREYFRAANQVDCQTDKEIFEKLKELETLQKEQRPYKISQAFKTFIETQLAYSSDSDNEE